MPRGWGDHAGQHPCLTEVRRAPRWRHGRGGRGDFASLSFPMQRQRKRLPGDGAGQPDGAAVWRL